MNDNKKWHKKLTTIFWWIIASLPIIFLLFEFLMRVLYANADNGSITNLSLSISSCNDTFDSYVIPQLKSTFDDLFIELGITNLDFLSIVFSWFIQAYLLHLVVDFILILPKVCQKLIEKVCD